MAQVTRSLLLPYSAEKLYELVEKIEDYPIFLPWIDKTSVVRTETATGVDVTATLALKIHGVSYQFTTRNEHVSGESISIRLVDGLFDQLSGEWMFTPLGEIGCKVTLNLSYLISAPLLSNMFSMVADQAANKVIEAFRQRAEKIYG